MKEHLAAKWTVLFVLAGWLAAAPPAWADLLDKSAWKVIGPDGKPIPQVTDEDLATAWTSPDAQVTGQAVLIDLGASYVVQRVVLDPGASITGYPRSLDVYAGPAPDQLTLCGRMDSPVEDSVKVITFNPVVARYLRLVIGKEQAGYPWTIADLDVYGHGNLGAMVDGNAVLVDADAPEILRLAAEDLGFYLGQASEGAFPVVTPDEAWKFRGLRFRLVTPRPTPANLSLQQSMSLEHFDVTRKDNDVTLSGETPRAVVYAVKELLERNGIRWTYAAANSELIPSKRAIDLSFLPCRAQPPVYVRQWHSGSRQDVRSEVFRWRVRSGLNSFGMNLHGTECLGTPSGLQRIWPAPTHTMGYILGDHPEKTHPEWYEGTTHKTGWAVVPDVTATGLIDFVIGRYKEEEAKKLANKVDPAPYAGFGLHPTDVPAWAVSDRAEKLLGPFRKFEAGGSDEVAMNFDYSNLYGYLINETAKRMQREMPGKLLAGTAYENHRMAPSKVAKFPSNVFMLLCLHQKPYNLPLSSAKLTAERENLEAWSKKCGLLGVWDYILLDERKGPRWHTPTPLVSALVDRYGWLAKHGFRYLGSQTAQVDPDNPWNGYAFTRVIYDPDVKTSDVIDEFFAGYYKEAAGPMKKYYTTFENYLIEHEIGLFGNVMFFSYEPSAAALPPELVRTLKQHLAAARQAAKRGFVKQRVHLAETSLEWAVGYCAGT